MYVHDKSNTYHHTVDMGHEHSCFARYANDRINEVDDNSRVEWREGKALLIAKEDIEAGEEITYSYWRDYWILNRDCLSESARQDMFRYFNVKDYELIYCEDLPAKSQWSKNMEQKEKLRVEQCIWQEYESRGRAPHYSGCLSSAGKSRERHAKTVETCYRHKRDEMLRNLR